MDPRSSGKLPGDVYLDASQTVTNKTFENCVINGNVNTVANLPNTALVNSGITINGATIALGGVVVTPNDDTKFALSAVDGVDATEKNIRITGTDGTTTSDVILKQGTNVTLTRNQNEIIITSSYVDTDTVTSIQALLVVVQHKLVLLVLLVLDLPQYLRILRQKLLQLTLLILILLPD